MPKRSRPKQSSSQSAKRQRSSALLIGAPSADDNRLQTDNNPTSSALSERPLNVLHPLSSLCIRVFSHNFSTFADEEHWKPFTTKWLEVLPEQILLRIFTLLKVERPRYLNHATITTYFMRGRSLSLDGELGVTLQTLHAIPRVLGGKLKTLELSDFNKFSDAAFASIFKGLPNLEKVVLRRCVKVGSLTVEALAKFCLKLRHVNLSFTVATAASLQILFSSLVDLEVLKIAGLQSLTDSTFTKVQPVLQDSEEPGRTSLLQHMKSLKIRHDNLSDASIIPVLQHCHLLERIDLSFTLLRHLPENLNILPIEKLSLTSTFVPSKDLVAFVAGLPRLRILNIGAMGVKAGTSSSISTATAMTLTDDALRQLTDALGNCPLLEAVNLVQNSKLGMTKRADSALSYFITHVGRRCQSLNLSGIQLRSEDLVGLFPGEDTTIPSALETLVLSKTLVDDDASPWLASCTKLETLDLAETRVSADGLLPVLDACHNLVKLNLTGCRGVRIADRRRFFEVWEEDRRTRGVS